MDGAFSPWPTRASYYDASRDPNGQLTMTREWARPKRFPYAQWSPDARALDVVGDKWTLLIVRELVSGPRRFVDVRNALPRISSEQLRLRLARMVADGLLLRHSYREAPPRVEYELTPRARALVPALAELARWGYEWEWSPPRAGEHVELGAIFRLLAGLVPTHAETPAGTVALAIVEPGAESREFTVELRPPAPAGITEGPAPDAAARIEGTADDWVAAIEPRGDAAGLRTAGEERLWRHVLETLRPDAKR
jgi:DNA-binding HxlR family transcriptional regulator